MDVLKDLQHSVRMMKCGFAETDLLKRTVELKFPVTPSFVHNRLGLSR